MTPKCAHCPIAPDEPCLFFQPACDRMHDEEFKARALAHLRSAPTPYPSLARQALNLASATARTAAHAITTGEVLVSPEETERRLSICRVCEHWDTDMSRCRLCGCYTRVKAQLSSEHCPDTPPRW